MSDKEYEYKAVQGEMVMVDFDTQVEKRKKPDGTSNGSYAGTNIMFKAFGRVNEKALTTKTYEFKPELRAQLEAVQAPKTLFTMNMFREVGTQFWSINDVQVGHVAQDASPSGNAQAQGSAPLKAGQAFYDDAPIGPVIGQCLNMGVELGILNKNNLDDPNAIRESIITYRKVKRQIFDLWEAADKEPQPKVQENEPISDTFDDDCPF